jgi:hypothetical protein
MQGGKRVAGGMTKYGGHGSFLMRSGTVVDDRQPPWTGMGV